MRYLLFLTFAAAFIVVAACARTSQLASNTAGEIAESTATPTPAPTLTPTPPDDAPRITLEEAKKAYDDGKAFVIDARAAEVYKAEHIKGAVNITYTTLDAHLKELPKDKTIIVYCS
jgi:3-mercaptopyruvate sulfurtransferase SseA